MLEAVSYEWPWHEWELGPKNVTIISERLWLVEKWDWDYAKALAFQKFCVEYLRSHKELSIFIFCSHPHCFTLGRGLQKSKSPHGLVDFDPTLGARLPFPLHPISRGGGITFHYPGQWVCYPILHLGRPGFTVYALIETLLKAASLAVSELAPEADLTYERELLGLWHENKKLASIGLSVSRLISHHGMALNIYEDAAMTEALNMVNPCGLPGTSFTQLEKIVQPMPDLFGSFHQAFKVRLLNKITA